MRLERSQIRITMSASLRWYCIFFASVIILPSYQSLQYDGTGIAKGVWPWFVAIHGRPHGRCGGAIIDPRWVIASASCFRFRSNTKWEAVVGDSEQTIPVQAVFIHEAHNVTHGYKSDIALLKLSRMLKTGTPTVKSIHLDTSRAMAEGAICHSAGWGRRSRGKDEKSSRQMLNLVELSWRSASNCSHHLAVTGKSMDSDELCFVNDGPNACDIATGSPVVCNKNGSQVLTAVVSHLSSECALTIFPGIYPSVAHYSQWIAKTISNN